jgi:hypothetical protein
VRSVPFWADRAEEQNRRKAERVRPWEKKRGMVDLHRGIVSFEEDWSNDQVTS